jgi:F-type H+-transporting ATPase subunit alpha
MPVEEQVAVIFAVTEGLVDNVDPDNIPDWEGQFREYLRNSHEEILTEIRDTQDLSDENEEALREAIEHFNENYEPEGSSTVEIGAAEEDEEEEEEG